ncbi:MAG: hypothetical protein CSB44_01120 [Gammaproteobacteria bacterium]|nr:MAG: hypothetical protein CSB44_01120 [Gammaproteobacteria bacterium]
MSDESPQVRERFWETVALDDMSDAEWESLCDGCGRCCTQKLEDIDTGQVLQTRVACQLLDCDTARCSDYANRFEKVPDCLSVRPITADKLRWLPASCAYRRLATGEALPEWHPLLSGSPASVVDAGISVAGRLVSESVVSLDALYRHVVDDDFELLPTDDLGCG